MAKKFIRQTHKHKTSIIEWKKNSRDKIEVEKIYIFITISHCQLPLNLAIALCSLFLLYVSLCESHTCHSLVHHFLHFYSVYPSPPLLLSPSPPTYFSMSLCTPSDSSHTVLLIQPNCVLFVFLPNSRFQFNSAQCTYTHAHTLTDSDDSRKSTNKVCGCILFDLIWFDLFSGVYVNFSKFVS